MTEDVKDEMPEHVPEFRAEARRRGIPAAAVEARIRAARPALYLAATEEGPLDLTLGGPPLLPADAPYPAEMFVAALDCAALPQGATDIPLPADGHLLFFSDPEVGAGITGDAVRWVPPGVPLERRTTPPEADDDLGDELYEERRLRTAFHQLCWTRGPGGDPDAAPLDAAWSHVVGPRPFWDFQLGGHPDYPQNNPVTAATTHAPIKDDPTDTWTLLATWTCDGVELLDNGTIHWVIRHNDLAAHRFDRVYSHVDML